MLKIEKHHHNLIVHLEGELTYENATEIKEEIKGRISKEITKIFFELSNLELIDSSGVGIFISILKSMEGDGVFVTAPQPKIARIFEITRLDQIIPIFPTLAEAGQK